MENREHSTDSMSRLIVNLMLNSKYRDIGILAILYIIDSKVRIDSHSENRRDDEETVHSVSVFIVYAFGTVTGFHFT